MGGGDDAELWRPAGNTSVECTLVGEEDPEEN